jgi:hypothetical protein
MAYESRATATKYQFQDGDTLASVLAAHPDTFLTWQDMALYNWGTAEPREVNRALAETFGVRTMDAADPSKTVLAKHVDAPNPEFFIAKVVTQAGLAAGKTYVAQLKNRLPPAAVGVDSLDRWFIPAKETCELKYTLEGSKAVAKKVVFEVYGSNYSDAGAFNKGLGTFPAAADKKDVALYAKDEQADAAERASLAIAEWKGSVTATEGALGKKTPNAAGGQDDRVINVAFSPYTAHLRYFLEDADKTARLLLEPFWPRFDAANAPIADSLKVRWDVKDTTRFTGGKGHGQLLVIDGRGTVVYQKPLKEAEMTAKGGGSFHEHVWAGGTFNAGGVTNSKGGTVAIPEDMPYRVRLDMHTASGETKGLALTAMQTEVRVYVHPQTHPLDLNPYVATTDKNSLGLLVSQDLLTTKPLTRADGTAWCKLQLAKAGFHPGPVDGAAGHAAYALSLKEMKRSVPKRKAAPADDFARFTIDATEGNDVKDALEDLTATPDWQRPWFGNSAGNRADLTPATATTTLNDATKQLILWVDDRHLYTDPSWLAGTAQGPAVRTKVINSAAATGNHMGRYTEGDAMVDKKAASIPRPWIPLAADFVLLGKGQDLAAVVPLPAAADLVLMRRAIGPLRVDWTFDEIDAEPPPETEVNVAAYDKRVTRSRAHTKSTLSTKKATHARKDVKATSNFHNCPVSAGGIRPSTIGTYYKAPFGLAADSLAPWTNPLDVASREAIATIVHDNLGQTGDELVPARLGQAGIYFRPSTIGGDSYRVRAQAQFKVEGGYKLPNAAVLEARYPRLPQVQSAAMRIWRKASVRAYVCWSANNSWAASASKTFELFEPAFLHFAFERNDVAVNSKVTDWFADNADFKTLVKESLNSAASATSGDGLRARNAVIKLTEKRLWPWYNDSQYGLYEASAPNATLAAARTALLDNQINPLFYTLSNLFSLELVNKIEAKKGKLRGHVIVEMLTTDKFYMQRYGCPTCTKKYYYAEAKETGNSKLGSPCPTPACAGTLAQLAPTYTGHYTCTPNSHKGAWQETGANIPNGGQFTGATCVVTGCGGTLNPDQAKHEEYGCATCGRSYWLFEPGAGGSHDGQRCLTAGCTGVLQHKGGTWKEKYACTNCAVITELVEPTSAGGSKVGTQHTACLAVPTKGTFKRQTPPVLAETHLTAIRNRVTVANTENSGFDNVPVSSLGDPLGVAWNFDGEPELWAHESAHCRHMEHAGNAGSPNNLQHDPTANASFNWASINETTAIGKQWDRACLMTYANHRKNYDKTRDKLYVCGRCAFKLRGWKLAGVANPAAAVKDP